MEFLLVLAGTSSLWVPVWYVARKTQRWYGWDYASVLGPIPFWFMLMTMGIGPMSLSNLFVELLAIAAFVPVAVSLRLFLVDRYFRDTRRSSIVVCAICFALPLVLRLAMPGIPE